MTHEERVAFVKAFVENRLLPVLNAKGPDYARQVIMSVDGKETGTADDCNNNFKTIAARIGSDKYKVWAIYWLKHQLAIETWLSTGDLRSESIEGRIVDAVNYLLILATMLHEDGRMAYPERPKVL